MKKLLAYLIGILLFAHGNAQTAMERPKIGLTLSGGAAKGLAHIGILKAIDSAGLKIDYLTGTSMGSVVGGLYAIGYSADSIEKMAHTIDWDLLLSNQSTLRSITMEEKSEYGRYALELPWENNRFRLPGGVLEGQELWLKLAELFAPVAGEKDFSRFSIPFKCIGTDISNGEAVVMSKGEIVNAIRSSMAIPSIFTAIEYEGKMLVDGGIVRNFPARDVKEMGADIIIGSNVATGLLPAKKNLNAIQVLLQVAFFREAEDRKNEVPLCDIYVPINLEKYTMGSFNQAEDIIRIGLEEGRSIFPRLKHLADSLDAIYGKRELNLNRLPGMFKSKISAFEIYGLQHTTPDFFAHAMGLLTGKYYTTAELAHMVRRAYGTRYYNRIVYALRPQPDGTQKIVYNVTENALTFSKLGIHYNEFSGISVLANITTRNFLLPSSRDFITLNIGENLRLRAEHLQYVGRSKNLAFIAGIQSERLQYSTYRNYKEDGVFKQNYFVVDGRAQYSANRNLSMGLGARFEWLHFSPSITSSIEWQGNNHYGTAYIFLNHNSLDRATYPKRGVKLAVESGLVLQQDPEFIISTNGRPLSNQPNNSYGKYQRTTLNVDSYTPLSARSVFMLNAQTGINYNYGARFMNEFAIGGLVPMFRNQVLFAGLKEGTFYSPSVASLQLGLRYELYNNTYLIGRANALVNNFVSKSSYFSTPDFLSGYALTFGYNFALGPLEFSAMYCDQSKQVRTYVNIGVPF